MDRGRLVPRLSLLLFPVSFLLSACGGGDPYLRVQRARAQFEATVQGSLQRPDQGALVLEVLLEKKGRRPLETLTLRVDQLDGEGRTIRADLRPVDVSGVPAYGSLQVGIELPHGGPGVVSVAPLVEPEPPSDRLAEYPEFGGIRPPGD